MKKNTKIGIAVLIGLIVLGLLFATSMFMFFKSILKNYDFTTDEKSSQYANAVGYTQYEDENIKFQYPAEWVIGNELTDSTDDISFVESLDPWLAPNIKYQIFEEGELGFKESEYNPFKFSVNTSSSGTTKTTVAERWLKVNDKKTFMYYTAGKVANHENEYRHNLLYYTFIGDREVMYVQISTRDKETLETIAASLEY